LESPEIVVRADVAATEDGRTPGKAFIASTPRRSDGMRPSVRGDVRQGGAPGKFVFNALALLSGFASPLFLCVEFASQVAEVAELLD